MSIIRGPRPDAGYYVLDNRIVEDRRLSWDARGLLIFLLAKPDHWTVSIEHLRAQTRDARKATGRDGIYAILAELRDAGYLTAEQSREAGGAFGQTNYVVSEVPCPPQPYTAEPCPAKPTLVSTERAVITETAVKDLVQRSAARPVEGAKSIRTSARFEEFWRAYPNRKGRAAAEAKWKARGLDAIADQILAHVELMKAQDDGWRRGWIPMGSTYINGSRWEDEPSGPAQPGGSGGGESGTMAALRRIGVIREQ